MKAMTRFRLFLMAFLLATAVFAPLTVEASLGNDCCGFKYSDGSCALDTSDRCEDGCSSNYPTCCQSGGFC